MQKKTNIFYYNGHFLSAVELASYANIEYDCLRKSMARYKQLDIIRKSKINNLACFIMNPCFVFKGKYLDVNLVKMFSNSEYSVYDDLTKYIPGRGSVEYDTWKECVMDRDNYMCICCGSNVGPEVHHILSFNDYPLLRYETTNGITLCHNHHSNAIKGGFHNIYGTKNNTPEQLQDYINNVRYQLNLPSLSLNEILNKF